MAGEDNLIPMSERTEEEARQMGAKGGKASGESRRRKKAMRENLEILLEMNVKGGRACNIEGIQSFAALKGKNITVEQAMLIAQIQKALKGDTNALAFIRDTSGQAPKNEIDFTGKLPVVITEDLVE